MEFANDHAGWQYAKLEQRILPLVSVSRFAQISLSIAVSQSLSLGLTRKIVCSITGETFLRTKSNAANK